MATILAKSTSAATLDTQPDTSSPTVVSSCLDRLVHNPMFTELQKTLAHDCQNNAVPFTLLHNGPDRREPHSPGGGDEDSGPSHEDVAASFPPLLNNVELIVEEATLQAEFRQLAPLQHVRVTELEMFYQTQSAAIVTRRLDTVARIEVAGYPVSRQQYELRSANAYYERQQVHLTVRVSKSLQLLKCMFALEMVPSAMSSGGKRKSRHLDHRAVVIMQTWFDDNVQHPYPSDDDKVLMAEKGGISLAQVKAWFANKRNRTLNTRPRRQQHQQQRGGLADQHAADLATAAFFGGEASPLMTSNIPEIPARVWMSGSGDGVCTGLMQEVS